jgi:glycosyltransferase involved in cell wall biosynthesis
LSAPTLAVALCTHNPRRDFLERSLASLRRQTVGAERWELLVIDNASDNGVPASADLAWHPRARLVDEKRVGLTMARLRAIAETKADLLLFVDDDNELDPDYIETLLRLAERYPHLGCFGAGRIEPSYEVEPPDELRPHTHMLALRSVGEARWSNVPGDSAIPWGAGLAVRRAVAEAYRERTANDGARQRLGRKGAELNSGEDDEFSWIACALGYGKGIFPELRVVHVIDRRRVQLEYLLRIEEGHNYSAALLDLLHGARPLSPEIPSLGSALGHLLRGHPFTFLSHLREAWYQRRIPPLERAFARARKRGIDRALASDAAEA